MNVFAALIKRIVVAAVPAAFVVVQAAPWLRG